MPQKISAIKNGGEITAPPGKSMAHRALICAALTDGNSVLHGIIPSEDMRATMRALTLLGAKINYDEKTHIAKVEGIYSNGGTLKVPNEKINCGESGSTLRFLIPLFSLNNAENTFCGGGKLMQRSQSVYQNLFAEKGLYFSQTSETIKINGALCAGEYTVKGDVSSQFISGLLFALSLLKSNSVINIAPPFESENYVHLTLQAMQSFGVNIEVESPYTFKIKGGQHYKAQNYTVGGDYSQAAFFAVLAAISGKQITIKNMQQNTLQGDAVIFDILKNCGAAIETHSDNITVSNGEGRLKAFKADIANCPDLGPILMVLALFCEGESALLNAARLRDKESDRIEAMQCEAQKIGGEIKATQNEVYIKGVRENLKSCKNLNAHNDHRIVMAMSVACAEIAAQGKGESEIDGADAVQKSYPNFFEHLSLFL